MKHHFPFQIVLTVLACALPVALFAASPPRIGEKAPDFALKTLDERTARLSEVLSTNPVVLVVLRGWPGYQCPLCTAQVQDYISSASAFTKSKVRVLMVYPGPAPDLKAHSEEFLKDKHWPRDFIYLLDPDFTMVNAYGLRWNAPGETSYPSTFVIDRKGVVRFAKISQSHGNRTKARDILEELKRIPTD